MKALSRFRILWELLLSLPLLLLLWVQLKTVELREKMKHRNLEKKASPEKAQKTSPMRKGSPAPAAAGTLSPFEIEAGKKASPESPESRSLEDRSSTGSPASEIGVNPRVAGGLLKLPFKCLHIAYPAALPLTEEEVEEMAEPFSDFLVENGLESVARSSIVLGFHLFIAGYSRVKAISDAKKVQKNEAAAKTSPGDGKAGPGKDEPRPPSDPGGGA